MSAIRAVYENGVFRPTQPVHLPQHCEVDLEIRVHTPPENGRRDAPVAPVSVTAIEETLSQLSKAASAAEWEDLPADLSDQLDHYVYGTPRQ